ncbi:MAG: hypothetical protein F7C07_05525 [Desulfurococcales archaeon]|nr:hypothetical protein [Desulfurococcales archaeon]
MYRKPVEVYVALRTDRGIEHLSVDSKKSKSELYELGARILLAIVELHRGRSQRKFYI